MNSDTVMCMLRTLKSFVTTERERLGLNQTELANRAGVPRTTVNRVETGITQLPNADVRRKLAKALGVSHLDILVAAGELNVEELEATGVQGVIEPGPKAHVHAIVDQYEWTQRDANRIGQIIQTLLGDAND